MLPLRLSNEPSYCLIYYKNSTDINLNGKIYHFTWQWLFFENTIVKITFEVVKRSIFWSDIPYEWYRLINKKSKIYHFIWQRLFDRKTIVNITFEIVKWAIGQLEFLEWCLSVQLQYKLRCSSDTGLVASRGKSQVARSKCEWTRI